MARGWTEEDLIPKAQDTTTAKQFLINRAVEQAAKDMVMLSDVEKAMLGFSESTATQSEMTAAETFDKKYDSDKYEAKIAKLLRRAYNRDKKSGDKALWKHSLATLGKDDCYLLVMVERAGIKIPGRSRALAANLLGMRTILTLSGLAIVGLAGFVFLIPLHGRGEPLAGDVIHSDPLRGLLFVVCVVMLWGIGRFSRLM